MGGVTPICRYRIYPTFFQKFFIFFIFFSYYLIYFLPQFYLIFSMFFVYFCLFLECFKCIFTLILCCWSIGFAVLFRYGCLRVNGKFRQKAILLLVYDSPKNCIYIWLLQVIVGYIRKITDNYKSTEMVHFAFRAY